MSNGNLDESIKHYINEEIRNNIPSEDNCKVRFFKLLKEAPDNSTFVEKMTSELIKRVDFWEQLNKEQAKRFEQLINEHVKNCIYRQQHDKYHKDNEEAWGLQLNIKRNVFKVIKWLVIIIVIIGIIAFIPQKALDLIRLVLSFK